MFLWQTTCFLRITEIASGCDCPGAPRRPAWLIGSSVRDHAPSPSTGRAVFRIRRSKQAYPRGRARRGQPSFDDSAWPTISTPHTLNDVDSSRQILTAAIAALQRAGMAPQIFQTPGQPLPAIKSWYTLSLKRSASRLWSMIGTGPWG